MLGERSDQRGLFEADQWKVALGVGIDERPFAKSTLQLFRAHLILHEEVRAVFQRSLKNRLREEPPPYEDCPGYDLQSVS